MRDTAHLSLVEVGAYNRILDHYYASGGPIDMTEAQVMRLCAAVTPEEQSAVKFVLKEFFVFEIDDGCYHNNRADRELVSMAEHHHRLSEAGKRGNAVRWQSADDRDGIAGRSRGDTRGDRISTTTITSTSTSTVTAKKVNPKKDLLARSRKSYGSKPPAPASDSVIFIPLSGTNKETGESYQHGVTPADVALYDESFPAVDVMQTLREIRAWCLANPTRCKTHRGVRRFITSWMHRVQNGGR